MQILKRGPNGGFIGNGEALTAWLPTLLTRCWQSPLSNMLIAAGRWCEYRAASQLEQAAEALNEWDTPPQVFAEARIAEAHRYFARKAILETARVQLEAIR